MASAHRGGLVTMLLALAGGMACERKPATPANVTVETVVPPRQDSGAVAPESPWRAEDGAFLVVAGDETSEGTVVPPRADDAVGRGVPQGPRLAVELLGRGGRVGAATLTPVRPQPCGWPRVRLALHDSLGDEQRWGVAFAPGIARAVPLDSLERLARGDSLRLVADLARMLSALPDDSVPQYRGLPFAVHGAWRFVAAPGVQGVVAEVHRRVGQEANPLEERLLVVAERDSTPGAKWRALWWARAQGTEESVEALDALAIVTLGADRWPTLVAGHDAAGGPWQELVARDSTGAWRARWRSPRPPACEGGAR
ncbi:MAG: hypothetical protein HY275_13985 [Gemmatimonadetes bacterium]|nr:hypothetical protein [Gemmatimonadota bacterium]